MKRMILFFLGIATLSAVLGFAGAELAFTMQKKAAATDDTRYLPGTITDIDTSQRSFFMTLLPALGESNRIKLFATADIKIIRRAFVREGGVVVGATDVPVSFFESLVPGEKAYAWYHFNQGARRFETNFIILGDILAGE